MQALLSIGKSFVSTCTPWRHARPMCCAASPYPRCSLPVAKTRLIRRFYPMCLPRSCQTRKLSRYPTVGTRSISNGLKSSIDWWRTFCRRLVSIRCTALRNEASAGGERMQSDQLKRRDFITLIGGAAAAWPLAARAQQRSKIPRIGYLDPLSRSSRMAAGWVEAFRLGLHDLGYAEGNNIIIEYRWSEGKYDRLAALTAELVHLGIDVLVTYGTPATRAAKQATTSVPIVMAISGDAIATGLISSLNRPGGNITGSTFFNPELCAKRLELIKEAVPPTIRVGVLLNPDNPIHIPCLQEMERTAKSINLELEPFQVHSPNEFESAFLAWDTKHVNAMTVIEDAML